MFGDFRSRPDSYDRPDAACSAHAVYAGDRSGQRHRGVLPEALGGFVIYWPTLLNAYSDELRLALVVLLNAGVFAAAYRFARRRGTSGVSGAICDAFLILFLVQYAAVALPGTVGMFSAWSMSVVAFATAIVLWIAAGPSRVRRPDDVDYWSIDRLGLLGCSVFALGFVGAYAWLERLVPPMATDSLVYHLPTVIHWMQTGRLGIYATWYWNPAASYSPATGMTFMAWLMAPAGNDVFVRFVQVPALVFVFFLTVWLCRVMGCGRTGAGLLGIAAMLSRSLFSEALFPKDDLFITAFVAAAILSLSHDALRDRLGPWRVGIAMGLVLASKYTVLLVCPVFLFMIDAPIRAGWRARMVDRNRTGVGNRTAVVRPEHRSDRKPALPGGHQHCRIPSARIVRRRARSPTPQCGRHLANGERNLPQPARRPHRSVGCGLDRRVHCRRPHHRARPAPACLRTRLGRHPDHLSSDLAPPRGPLHVPAACALVRGHRTGTGHFPPNPCETGGGCPPSRRYLDGNQLQTRRSPQTSQRSWVWRFSWRVQLLSCSCSRFECSTCLADGSRALD